MHFKNKNVPAKREEMFTCEKNVSPKRDPGFMIDYMSAYKSQMAFIVLDLEVDKPRMTVELKVMMTEM